MAEERNSSFAGNFEIQGGERACQRHWFPEKGAIPDRENERKASLAKIERNQMPLRASVLQIPIHPALP